MLGFSIQQPRGSTEAIPGFQLEQIKTSVQKTEHATQKPKSGKKLSIKKLFRLDFEF